MTLATLFFASIGFAAQSVKLEMNMTFNGKASHPQVIAKFGQAATISMIEKNGNGYEISILPTEVQAEGKQAVKFEMVVSKIENNQKTDVSHPKVITRIGEEARITQSGKDMLDLSILPTSLQ